MKVVEINEFSDEALNQIVEVIRPIIYSKDKEIERLNNIINKAIEYIEQNKQISMFADLRKEGTRQYDLECDADDLLNILKGEDK